MKRMTIALCAAGLALSGCDTTGGGGGYGFGGYTLVRPRTTAVGDGSMLVTPPREWNKVGPAIVAERFWNRPTIPKP